MYKSNLSNKRHFVLRMRFFRINWNTCNFIWSPGRLLWMGIPQQVTWFTNALTRNRIDSKIKGFMTMFRRCFVYYVRQFDSNFVSIQLQFNFLHFMLDFMGICLKNIKYFLCRCPTSSLLNNNLDTTTLKYTPREVLFFLETRSW